MALPAMIAARPAYIASFILNVWSGGPPMQKSLSMICGLGIAIIGRRRNSRASRRTRKAAYLREHRRRFPLRHEHRQSVQSPRWPATDHRIRVWLYFRAGIANPDEERDDGRHGSRSRFERGWVSCVSGNQDQHGRYNRCIRFFSTAEDDAASKRHFLFLKCGRYFGLGLPGQLHRTLIGTHHRDGLSGVAKSAQLLGHVEPRMAGRLTINLGSDFPTLLPVEARRLKIVV